MSVVGLGVDIIKTDFLELLSERDRLDYIDRCFTENERAAAGSGVNSLERLAGRFAAKEAVLKALGIGFGDGVSPTDVDVVTLESGAPEINLTGIPLEVAAQRGVISWLISTSHAGCYAMAVAIGLGAQH